MKLTLWSIIGVTLFLFFKLSLYLVDFQRKIGRDCLQEIPRNLFSHKAKFVFSSAGAPGSHKQISVPCIGVVKVKSLFVYSLPSAEIMWAQQVHSGNITFLPDSSGTLQTVGLFSHHTLWAKCGRDCWLLCPNMGQLPMFTFLPLGISTANSVM